MDKKSLQVKGKTHLEPVSNSDDFDDSEDESDLDELVAEYMSSKILELESGKKVPGKAVVLLEASGDFIHLRERVE